MPGSSLSSILQQSSQLLASLPTPLIYAGGAALGVLLTILITTRIGSSTKTSADQQADTSQQSLSSTGTNAPTETTHRSSSSDTGSELPGSQEPGESTHITAPEEDDSTESAKERQQDPSTQEWTATTTDRLPTARDPTPSKVLNQRTPSTGVTRDGTGDDQLHRHTTDQSSTRLRGARQTPTRLPLRQELRQELIDTFQVETGVEPVAFDPSWSLVKVDAGVSAVSADTGGELIDISLQSAPVSYEAINSPIELTVSALLRRLVRNTLAAPSTEAESQDDHMVRDSRQVPQNRWRSREPSDRHHIDERQHIQDRDTVHAHQQQSIEKGRSIDHRITTSRHERLLYDQGIDYYESSDRSANPEPHPRTNDSIEDSVTPLLSSNDQLLETRSLDRSQTDIPQDFNAIDHREGPFDDSVLDAHCTAELEAEQTSQTIEPALQGNQYSETVDMSLQRNWEPPEVESSTLKMDGDSIEAPTFEAATPQREPANPFAERGQRFDKIDAGPVLEEPVSQEMDLGWEDESIDVSTAVFGGGMADKRVTDTEFSPGFSVDDNALSMWNDIDRSQEEVFSTSLQL